MCECHKIGGPWISYDPACPARGDEAQAQDEEFEDLKGRERALREQVKELEGEIARLSADLSMILNGS